LPLTRPASEFQQTWLPTLNFAGMVVPRYATAIYQHMGYI
jgi:hypothetical protein